MRTSSIWDADKLENLFEEGLQFHQSGNTAAAETRYIQTLNIYPAHTGAQHMLGVIRAQQQRYREALALIGDALRKEPTAVTLSNYGNVLVALGRPAEALEYYERTLAIDPGDFRSLTNRGNALNALELYELAVASYDAAILQAPEYADAWSNRCAPLLQLGLFEDALESSARALALKPDYSEAIVNRGDALFELRRLEEALASYDHEVQLNPENSVALCNRGIALRDLGRLPEASNSLERAVLADANNAHARWTKSLCHLLQREFSEGWRLFEWHKKLPKPMELREYVQQPWTGAQDIQGKTLFMYLDDGIGDVLQFIRYARLTQERGARTILSAPNALRRLLRGLTPPVEIIDAASVPKEFDYHLSLIDLPAAFKTDENSIPATRRYLNAEPGLITKWAKIIGAHGFKVGISWQGKNRLSLRGRSFPLSFFRASRRFRGFDS